MLWLKSLHVIFVVTWFAGLFYLPRLFVYHSMANDSPVRATLKIMERRLLVMMHIGGAMAWYFGASLLIEMPYLLDQGWMRVKIALVLVLTIYHFWCATIVKQLAHGEPKHGDVWYRWFNEFPTLILFAVVILAVVKPF